LCMIVVYINCVISLCILLVFINVYVYMYVYKLVFVYVYTHTQMYHVGDFVDMIYNQRVIYNCFAF